MALPLYSDLVEWYPLLDPLEDHEDEVAGYHAAFERLLGEAKERRTLLELGAGAGHNGFFLKHHYACTLTDLSEGMLGRSRALNPSCEHQVGDMRTLRLGRTFDIVLVHDAICYMTTQKDLRAAAETAFVHTRPGGCALFAPDCVRESFIEHSQIYEGTSPDGQRALRCMEWMWDPDPSGETYSVEYAFMLRENGDVRHVADRHCEGLFSKATWYELLRSVGFVVEPLPRLLDHEEGPLPYADEIFLCRRD